MTRQQNRLMGEINTILSYYFNGCRTPVTLFCETNLETTGRTALTLLTFGWDDIVRTFWRPKGLRSGRHGRKARKRPKHTGVPEIPDLVAEHLPIETPLTPTGLTDGTKIMWILDEFVQRAIWEVAILQITEEYAFKTLLTALTLKATHCDHAGRVLVRGGFTGSLPPTQWYAIWIGVVEYVEAPCAADPYNIHMGGSDTWQILGGMRVTNEADHEAAVELELRVTGNPHGATYYRKVGPLSPGGHEDVIITVIVHGHADVAWYQKGAGACKLHAVSLQAFPSYFSE